MTPVILQAPLDVSARLGQLGLAEDLLREAVRQGLLHRSRLTSNHPRTYPGLVMWGETLAALGELLRPLHWERRDIGSFSIVVNDELALAISVLSGDEAAGNAYANPANRSKKGRNTIDAIEVNRQADMFQDLLDEVSEDNQHRDTWMLLHHTDTILREVRMELSCPYEIGEDGKITEWSERILLGSIPFDDDIGDIDPLDGPDIDFDIMRKSS